MILWGHVSLVIALYIRSLKCPISVVKGEASVDLKRVQNSSSTNRYRVFECVVNIAVRSEEALNLCSMSGFLDELLKDLDGNDVLAQLNCVSLLADLSSVQHGLLYLGKRRGFREEIVSLQDQK